MAGFWEFPLVGGFKDLGLGVSGIYGFNILGLSFQGSASLAGLRLSMAWCLKV